MELQVATSNGYAAYFYPAVVLVNSRCFDTVHTLAFSTKTQGYLQNSEVSNAAIECANLHCSWHQQRHNDESSCPIPLFF